MILSEKTTNLFKNFYFHLFNLSTNSFFFSSVSNNEIMLQSAPTKFISLLKLLKKSTLTQFQILTDITVYDEPTKKHRFTIIYSLLSIKFNIRLQISVKLHELQNITSVTQLYKSAFWAEREVWDLYGIFFSGHKDLRRILTDYNFSGHPLRKDFPLSGYIDLFYDDKQKRIVYVPVEITQEYRNFNFQSPWQ